MRILQLTDFYPPVIGGLERHVQTLAHELARRGHEVAVATLAHPSAPAFEQDGSVRVHRLSGWHRALAPFYQSPERPFHPTVPDPGVMAALRRVIAREQPEIINAHSWLLYSLLPLARDIPARIVVTLHDYGLTCPKKTMMRGEQPCPGPALPACVRCASAQYGPAKAAALTLGLAASSRLHRRAHRYVAVSRAVAEATAPATGAAGRAPTVIPTLIPDGVLDEAASVGRPDFLPPDDGYLLFVGVLSRHKGLHTLLEAYAGLRHRVPLLLIGTPYGDAPAGFPEGVRVVHNVPHAQVMAAWSRCAIGVVPSRWPDPCPQVAIEAMTVGRPLVASRTGGLPDLVAHGETGLLVPPGDVAALREALDNLLGDPERRARMGAAARGRARSYRAAAVTDRIEALYAEVLAAV